MYTALDKAKNRLKKAHTEAGSGETKKAAEDAARAIRAMVEAANASNFDEAWDRMKEALQLLNFVFINEGDEDGLTSFASAKGRQAWPTVRKYMFAAPYAKDPALRTSAEQMSEWCTAIGCYRHMMAVALRRAAALEEAQGGGRDAAAAYEDAAQAFQSAASFYRRAARWEGGDAHEKAEAKLELDLAGRLAAIAATTYLKARDLWWAPGGDIGRGNMANDDRLAQEQQAINDRNRSDDIRLK